MIRLSTTASLLCFLATAALAEDRPSLNVAIQSMGMAGSMDNMESNNTAQRKYQSSIFEQLIALDFSDPNLATRPGLAESWSWVSPTVLEVKIRRGVLFHNGDEMTAEDVAFSFSDERFGLLPEQKTAREAAQETATLADGTKTIVPPAAVAAIRMAG